MFKIQDFLKELIGEFQNSIKFKMLVVQLGTLIVINVINFLQGGKLKDFNF